MAALAWITSENVDKLWWVCGQRISKSSIFSLSFSVWSPPSVLCHWPRIYRSVGVHENGKGQPFNQAFKAMRQELDILKYFLF